MKLSNIFVEYVNLRTILVALITGPLNSHTRKPWLVVRTLNIDYAVLDCHYAVRKMRACMCVCTYMCMILRCDISKVTPPTFYSTTNAFQPLLLAQQPTDQQTCPACHIWGGKPNDMTFGTRFCWHTLFNIQYDAMRCVAMLWCYHQTSMITMITRNHAYTHTQNNNKSLRMNNAHW